MRKYSRTSISQGNGILTLEAEGRPQTGSALPRQEKRASMVGVNDLAAFERNLPQDVATREARKASRAHAPDSPMSAEHMDV